MLCPALLFVAALSAAQPAGAAPAAPSQVPTEATAPTLLTADNTSWYLSASPITWNGDLYYPAGRLQAFDADRLVRSGAYQGIPIYTDAAIQRDPAIEPYSILFIPISGWRVQPYERRRAGLFAGTTASHTPLVTDMPVAEETMTTVAVPEPVATSGRTLLSPSPPVTSAVPPTGANTIWIEFEGRRWYAAEKSIRYDAAQLVDLGTYEGWKVYALKSDAARRIIYIASVPGRLSGYRLR